MPCIGRGGGFDENMPHGGNTVGTGNPLASANETGALDMPFQLQISFEIQ